MNLSPLGRCYGQTASMRLMLTMWSERALGGPTGGNGPPVTARKNEPQPCLRRRRRALVRRSTYPRSPASASSHMVGPIRAYHATSISIPFIHTPGRANTQRPLVRVNAYFRRSFCRAASSVLRALPRHANSRGSSTSEEGTGHLAATRPTIQGKPSFHTNQHRPHILGARFCASIPTTPPILQAHMYYP